MSRLQFAAIQLDVGIEESVEERKARVANIVHEQAQNGADVVLLPEMWVRGFFDFDHYAELAEPVDGPIGQFLAKLARESGVVVVGGSFVERDDEDFFNTSPVYDRDGSRIALYRKIHLFSYQTAREDEILTRGEDVVVFDLPIQGSEGGATARTGLSICYDLRFPELYRDQVDRGAEVLLVVSCWPYPRLGAWQTLVRARAVENQAAIVACNAVGEQSGQRYFGHSASYDAWGSELRELDDEPGILWISVDIDEVREARREFPPLRDRVLGTETKESEPAEAETPVIPLPTTPEAEPGGPAPIPPYTPPTLKDE